MVLKKLFPQVIFILVLSMVGGLSVNAPLVSKFLKGDFKHSFISPDDFPSITFITLAEAEDYFMSGEAVFVDSRDNIEFRQGHVLNAVNVPHETGHPENVWERLDFPQDKPLVIYCDGSECQSSINLAKILHQRGFTALKVFFGGWAEWKESGLPTQSQDDQQ
jgi:rhodanese-related sulfurtransferase